MKANLVKMNIIPVNKPEPKLTTLQSITTGGGQPRLISTIVKQEDDLDDIKPVTTKSAKVHDVKDLISKASETNIKRENNDSIVTIPPPLTAPPGGDISKDFNRLASNISSSSTCDSKHSDLNVIKPNTTTTHSSSSKQESLTSKSTSSKVKSSSEHHSSRSSHHDSDRKSSSKHSHRHDKHHSSSASKHHHSSSSSKKVVNTGVQCDELPKPLSESCSTKPSLPPSSLVGGIAPVRHRMFGMMGANPLTNVENSNYKYGHLMYVER